MTKDGAHSTIEGIQQCGNLRRHLRENFALAEEIGMRLLPCVSCSLALCTSVARGDVEKGHNQRLSNASELIVSSPLRRTLQTAMYGLSWLVQRGVPVVARAEWQGSYSCILFPESDLPIPQRSRTSPAILARSWPECRPIFQVLTFLA